VEKKHPAADGGDDVFGPRRPVQPAQRHVRLANLRARHPRSSGTGGKGSTGTKFPQRFPLRSPVNPIIPTAHFFSALTTRTHSMSTELMTELLEAGVHFGHQTKRWNPKMKPFIFEKRNAIYIINLGKTVEQLDEATKFLSEVTSRRGKVLFVGCKKQAQEAIKEAALACGQFYVNQRWLGGTLTNLTTLRKSIARMKYIEDLEKKPEYSKMGKQEISAVKREGEKLKRNLEGIRDMEKHPDAIVVIDTMREGIAVAEANRLNIPVVAIVDTNADPDLIKYPIAGNDDAIRAIRIVLQKLVDAIVSTNTGRSKKDQEALAAVGE
jgi:small subunit ribosomal protein S2